MVAKQLQAMQQLQFGMTTLETRFTDTRLIRSVSFVATKSSYIFSKINPLYTDTG